MKISSTSVPQLQPVRNTGTTTPETPATEPVDTVVTNSGPSRARSLAVGVGAVAIAGVTAGLAFSGNGIASGIAGGLVGVVGGGLAAGIGTSKLMGKPMGGGTGTGLAIAGASVLVGLVGAIGGGIGGAILAAQHGHPMVGLAVGAVAAAATGVAIYRADHKN